MRLIHCGDLHLDSKLTTKLDRELSIERRRELLSTYERMVEFADRNKVSGIIIAGDLFDSDIISDEAFRVVWNSIVSNPHIDFYYLEGNHEKDGFTNSLSYIPDNLKLFDEEWNTYIVGEYRKISINGIISYEANASMYDNLVLDKDLFNIVVMHGQVYDNNNQKDYHAILLPRLRDKGIDYLALGHIHSHRIDKLDARGMYCYSGCLEPRGFDEVGKHGFILLDIDESNRKVVPRFIPFSMRSVEEIVIDVTNLEDSSALVSNIDLLVASKSRDNMLNIRLVGELPVEDSFNLDYIRDRYNEMFYLARVADETNRLFNYKDYEFDESLRGEFIRNVRSEDIDEDFKADIIRCGMLALSNKEVRSIEDN